MLEFKRHIWAEINLNAIKHNLTAHRSLLNGAKIIAVIKANAYGHGAIETAQLLKDCGVDFFAVSSAREAAELRQNGINEKILLLGYTSTEETEFLADQGLSVAVYSCEQAYALSEKLEACGKKLNIHIKLNTGMNRLGFDCTNTNTPQEIANILKKDCFVFEGLFTHFASADKAGDSDLSKTKMQADRFINTATELSNLGFIPKMQHCCNSAGIITMPNMHLDAVRLGISLYGYTPDTELELPIKLQPALSLKSTVVMVHKLPMNEAVSYGRTFVADKDTTLATISAGYADGYPRMLSNCGEVLIGGKRCKIAGRVCMDQIVVDVSHLDSVKEGDEVVLIGSQGDEFISAEEIAELCNTINYEIVCGISHRVPRYYCINGAVENTADYIVKGI